MHPASRHPSLGVVVIGLLLAACGGRDAPASHAARSGDSPARDAAGGGAGVQAVLGTIQATVDGEARTWHVVSGTLGGKPYASALWMGDANGERQVMAGGFDTPNPPIASFERDARGMPISYGDYQGSVFTIVVTEGDGPFPASLRFPSREMSGETGAFYQRRATLERVLEETYWLHEGGMEVTSLAIEGGTARVEGKFSGTFRLRDEQGSVTVTDGRFEIRGIPAMSILLP